MQSWCLVSVNKSFEVILPAFNVIVRLNANIRQSANAANARYYYTTPRSFAPLTTFAWGWCSSLKTTLRGVVKLAAFERSTSRRRVLPLENSHGRHFHRVTLPRRRYNLVVSSRGATKWRSNNGKPFCNSRFHETQPGELSPGVSDRFLSVANFAKTAGEF